MREDIFEEIALLRRQRVVAALATVIGAKGSTPAKVPSRMIVTLRGRHQGTVGGGCIEADVIRAARDVMDTGRAQTLRFHLAGEEAERTGIACGGIVDIMIEPLDDPRVVIVGAGHVGQAVSRLAAEVGLRVTVVDDRPDFAHADRFPEADERVVVPLENLEDVVKVTPQTSILIMTREHRSDYDVLLWALKQPARHIGVLGSRSKRKRFLEDLRSAGLDEGVAERFFMPVGLDIGAESVPEIAVSIVAQLIAARRGTHHGHG